MSTLAPDSAEVNFCVQRYLNDFDYRYSIEKPTIDSAFINDIIQIIDVAYKVAVIGNSLLKLYAYVKEKYLKKKEEEILKPTKNNVPLNILGNGATIYFKNVRPFYVIPEESKLYFYNVRFMKGIPSTSTPYMMQTHLDVPKGASLLLQNAIISYDGELGKFIKEYAAPSFFLVRVAGLAS